MQARASTEDSGSSTRTMSVSMATSTQRLAARPSRSTSVPTVHREPGNTMLLWRPHPTSRTTSGGRSPRASTAAAMASSKIPRVTGFIRQWVS